MVYWRRLDRECLVAHFTIGHSNHAVDRLIALLLENGVTTVVDVRSARIADTICNLTAVLLRRHWQNMR